VNEGIERLHAIFRRGREREDEDAGRMHEISLVLCPLPEAPADRREE
jgi:hypothetical protein